MTKPPVLRGSCNCSQVRFEIGGKIGPVGQCHCSKCRKASGTDGNAVFYTASHSLTITSGEDYVSNWTDGGWGHAFCKKCGSPVPSRPSGGQIWYVPAGLMDDDIGSSGYAAHIHVASKASLVTITDDAPQFPEGFES